MFALNMSLVMRKLVYARCKQQRHGSDCSNEQADINLLPSVVSKSDQGLQCLH